MNNVNGWVILYKPRGITSTKALAIVKKIFNAKKAGHVGTLDPEAEGVLPIALGEATKAICYITNEVKGYEFKLKFGVETTTGDIEGQEVSRSDFIPTEAMIQEALGSFTGKIKQVPPIYSAIKINGQRAYDLARKNMSITMPEREVTIFELKLLEFDRNTNIAQFYTKCSKGTYIRSLAADFAKFLGSCGMVTAIKRVQSGDFFVNDAIMLDNLQKKVYNTELSKCIKATQFVLDDIPVVELTTQTEIKVRNGLSIKIADQDCSELQYKAVYQGKLVAIGCIVSGFFMPKRVFNL